MTIKEFIERSKRRLKKPRFLFVYPLVVGLIVVARITEFRFMVGAALATVGVFVRMWANGFVGHVKVNWTQKSRNDDAIGHLVTAGPYAYVRHPLYVGTLLIGAGVCVIVGNLWLSLIGTLAFFLIYNRKIDEEETMIRDEVGEAFVRYQQMVPRWVPRCRAYPDQRGAWSWQGILASKEPKTLAWVAIFLILLYFRKEIVQDHRWMAEDRWVAQTALIGLACLFIVGDIAFEWYRHRAVSALQNPGRN